MQTTTDLSQLPPETYTKRKVEPGKRGRRGNKINAAIVNIPVEPMNAEAYATSQGISLNALRQYKRFYDQFEPEVQQKLGTIKIRLNKETRQLMVWRIPNE